MKADLAATLLALSERHRSEEMEDVPWNHIGQSGQPGGVTPKMVRVGGRKVMTFMLPSSSHSLAVAQRFVRSYEEQEV